MSELVNDAMFMLRLRLWKHAVKALCGLVLSLAMIPCQGQEFKGRIAYSADGNYNDEDDWAASPMALAILSAFSVKDKLVHFDYNCILPKNDKKWAKIHREGLLEAASRYGYPSGIFHDCQENVGQAVNSIAEAINNSSEDDPLYYILAGPMEVPYKGIMKADQAKRKFVYCISHSHWNDGYASGDLVEHTKRDVIPTGVTWIQITDQNKFLSTGPFGRPSNEQEWRPWQWMKDSPNSDLNFLYDRLLATTRADCSDAGMAYFLMTGDERPYIAKLRTLLEDRIIPEKLAFRDIRLEAENFQLLDGYEVEYVKDRQASHHINVKLTSSPASISTRLLEPYMEAQSRYNVDIRYYDRGTQGDRYSFLVNGVQQDEWQSAGTRTGWVNHKLFGIHINQGAEIKVTTSAESIQGVKLDYIQLNRDNVFTIPSGGLLDDPEAKPGQIIVAGSGPGYLKYNGGGPVFLSGPDNPEDFLFRGTLNPDGTRTGGKQEEMIERLAKSGVNAFHFQMTRMRICNIKDEGDDQHSPFNKFDPSKGLNQAVLNQWDRWLDLLEQQGIIVHLEFYNDATDVEMMGWKLDNKGELHPDEQAFFQGIVNKFKHHKNIMWGIEESCNKLPRSRVPHFKKLGQLIADTDNFNHPIVQSFVIPEDPEGDFPGGGGTPDDYVGDPNIRVVTWLHVIPHEEDFQAQHEQYRHYYNRDSRNFVVMKNETFHHPRSGFQSRRYMWSSAMAGLHSLEAYHHADNSDDSTLRDDGLLRLFMQRTNFHELAPRDDLRFGSTQWVLAKPSHSYVAYTFDYDQGMGLKGLPAGDYDLIWFDTVSGEVVEQTKAITAWEDIQWEKPAWLGTEIALHVTRRKW